MKTAERNKLAVLMAFHLMWGCVLWFSISKYGLGVSTDSVHLLFGGLNLSEGHGLISYDGSFLMLWPPLYPVLLALVHLASGLDMLATAGLLQTVAFLGLSLCLSILFLRTFPENFLLAIAATLLSDVGAPPLIGFNMVGSDYVFLLLAMACVLLTAYYVESRSPRAFVALAAVGMLATLERYLGIAALATGATGAVFLVAGSLRQRLMRGFVLAMAALPAGIWLVITSQLYGKRDPISFTENFNWFSRSMLEWLFPLRALKPHLELYTAGLWIVILGLLLLVLWWPNAPKAEAGQLTDERSGSRSAARSLTLPVLIFAVCYLFSLFGAASVTYSNKLGGRFLLPLYIPVVTLLVAAAEIPLRGAAKIHSRELRLAVSTISYGVLAVMAVLLLQVTLPLVIESRSKGAAGGENAFNNAAWRENPVVKYWLSNRPQGQYLLISNEPDGVAILTQHATSGSPRKASGPYATENYPLSEYVPDLFSSGVDVYLLWIEPNSQPYFYTPEEIASIATIEPLFASDGGGVYRLLPKPGS